MDVESQHWQHFGKRVVHGSGHYCGSGDGDGNGDIGGGWDEDGDIDDHAEPAGEHFDDADGGDALWRGDAAVYGNSFELHEYGGGVHDCSGDWDWND